MIYPDTSALVSLFLDDSHSPSARALILAAGQSIRVADFAIAEFSAVIAAAIRDRRVSDDRAGHIFGLIDHWAQAAARIVVAEPSDVRDATAFVRDAALGLRAPDALHLAICRRIGAQLLTFDRRQADAAAALGITVLGV